MRGLKYKPNKDTAYTVIIRRARGCTLLEIAESLGISVETLTTHYSEELRTAKAAADDEVYSIIREKMRAGSERLLDLYARTQLRWKTADSQGQEDAARELAAATEKANALSTLTKEMQGHLLKDIELKQEKDEDK